MPHIALVDDETNILTSVSIALVSEGFTVDTYVNGEEALIGLEKKEQWAVKLFFEYFYGKPQQRVDVTSNEETLNMPVITFVETETE